MHSLIKFGLSGVIATTLAILATGTPYWYLAIASVCMGIAVAFIYDTIRELLD